MAIEIVDFPIKTGDFPWQNVSSPEGRLDLILHRRDELDFHVGLCWIIHLDLTHCDDGRVFYSMIRCVL